MVDAIKILGSLLGSGVLSKGSGNSALGTLLTSALSSAMGGGRSGGAADILGGLLGGGQSSGSAGGLGSMLGGLLSGGGQQQPAPQGGGMADILGGLLGGGQGGHQTQTGNGLGGALGNLLGGGQTGSNGAALGDLLSGALAKYGQGQAVGAQLTNDQVLPNAVDTQEAEQQAMVLIRAMINAAKSDNQIDDTEREKILSRLDGLSQTELAFIRTELESPLDVDDFIHSVPRGMEQQVYTVSLMAIDLDTQSEARYLHQLAQGFNLDPQTCNEIHAQLNAPALYS